MRKLLNIVYIFIFLIIGTSVCADGFSNNLLKTDITKSEVDGVNINLSTSKPYQDKVIVNKKNDNEYVILMPETTNSTVSKPQLNGVSDIISDVSIKTQQYEGNIKGYTKITIKTTRPVTINPKLKVAKIQNTISEKEIAELMSNAKSVKSSPQKNIQKAQKQEVKPNNIKESDKKNLSVQKTKSVERIKSAEKIKSLPLSVKPAAPTKKSKASIDNKTNEKLNVKTEIKNEIKVTQDDTEMSVSDKPVEPKDAVENPVEKEDDYVNAQNNVFSEIQPVAENSINQNLSTKQLILRYIKIIKNNILILLMLFFISLASMLLIAKNMSTSLKKAKENFNSHLNEIEKAAVNYSEKVNDDMSWQEKYKVCSDSNVSEGQESLQDDVLSNQDMKSDIDNLFNNSQEETLGSENNDIDLTAADNSIVENQDLNYNINIAQNVQEASEPADMSNSSILDDNEQVLQEQVLNQENSYSANTNSEINPADYENEEVYDENLSAQDLFSEDENEILDIEKIKNTDISEITVQNNEVDTAYNIQSEDDISVNAISIEQNSTYNPAILAEDETDLISKSDNKLYNSAYNFNSENIQDSLVLSQNENMLDENLIAQNYDKNDYTNEEPLVSSDSVIDEDELVKSEFVIDENRGFYLVDLDNSSALVGHIKDEIFVLKRFETLVDAPLKARVNEKELNSTRYMTRIGHFRGVVEVTQDKMDLLVEL